MFKMLLLLQLKLGLPRQALHLLDEVFVTLLTHGTADDKGSCSFLYARCLALSAMQNKDQSGDQYKKGIEQYILNGILKRVSVYRSYCGIMRFQFFKH